MKKIYLILICALVAASCEREAELLEAYELGCPDASQYFRSPDAGSHVFEIFANGEYTAVINDPWLSFTEHPSVTQLKGNGDGTISVSFTENLQETRTGTITMTRGTRVFDLVIKQRGALSSDAGVVAELVAASSSTLTFTWGMLDSEKKDYEHSYRFCLYRDAALTDLCVSHETDSTTSIWSKRSPVFTFGGLENETEYWFVAHEITLGVDEQGQKTVVFNEVSDPVSGTTTGFETVQIGEAAENGTVVLAEDFSELVWNGDDINQGAGFRAKDFTQFVAPQGENPEGTLMNCAGENGLFELYGCGEAVKNSRLSGWAKTYEPAAIENTKGTLVCARPGYLKFGGQNYSGSLVTPEFSCIPEGKSADVEVAFTASRYGTDSENVILKVVQGEMNHNEVNVAGNGNTFSVRYQKDSVQLNLKTAQQWNTYTCQLKELKRDSRIMIGPDYVKSGCGGGRSQHRLFLDDIAVKILSLYDDITPTGVGVEKVCYSEATVVWDEIAAAESYNVYKDGVKLNEEPLTVTSMYIDGLKMNTEYSIVVSAVQGTLERKSDPVIFRTKNVWLYDAGPTHVCVQWDDISAYTLTNGSDRAYEMVLYKDEACTQVHAKLYPFNGLLNNSYAFAGSAWLGKTGNVANMYDTRVSFGMLQPETTYWFRVRSLASVSVNKNNGDPVVLTNAAGDSQWSDPLPVTTKSVHVTGSKEVIYQGFDHFSIGRDMHNQCVGASPKITTASDRLGFASLDSYDGEWVCQEMAGSYRIDEWGFASLLEGADENYLTGKVFNGMWNYVGTDGWHYGQYHDGSKLANNLFAEMGYLHVDSKTGTYVGTPQLYNNLSADGTECTLTFKGFANFASYNTNKEKPLKLLIYRAETDTVEGESCPGIPYKYTMASPTKEDFRFDVSWKTVSRNLTLYPGDAVIIVNNGASRFMIDDITIITK